MIAYWLWTNQKIGSHFADSEQVKKYSSYFAEFEQIEKLSSYFC